MLAPAKPTLSPILDDDLGDVGDYLHRNLNHRVAADAWSRALRVPWAVDAPNHGFQLTIGDQIVGVYLAFYSSRVVDGRAARVCNLGAWCVDDAYRSQGLRLLRAMLAQRDYLFTDLSPSGNVVGINERLGFRRVDTPLSMLLALPWPSFGRVRVSSDPAVIERTLRGRDLEIYRDHRSAAAALHVVVTNGDDRCYVVLRRDARKGVRCFGTVLFVSNPQLFHSALRPLLHHLLFRFRIPLILVEEGVAGRRARGSVVVDRLRRPKMVRNGTCPSHQIDYLYSELTCVAW